jgi:hypothetical protein
MRTSLWRSSPSAARVLAPAPDVSYPQLPATQPAGADLDCDIGAAIAILMGRFPVSYTKAFAVMLAYSDRTQLGMPDLASAVLKTYSPQPSDAAAPSANRTPRPFAGARR